MLTPATRTAIRRLHEAADAATKRAMARPMEKPKSVRDLRFCQGEVVAASDRVD
jgi:hypothetical protein